MKKGILFVIIVGIVCLGIGFGGSFLIFGYGKLDYKEIKEANDEIKDEIEELKDKNEKINQIQLENGSQVVVSLKNQNIFAGDLYESMLTYNGLETLIYLIDEKILEEKYSTKLEEAQTYVENMLLEYKSYYGSDFQQALQSYGFQYEEQFKKRLYVNYLQTLAIEDYCKQQISDKEIEKYYKNEIVGDIKISHILISASVTDDMSASEKEAAEKEAKEKVEAIIQELNSTDKGEIASLFAKLAKEYSQDESTKDNDGSLGYINKNTLSSNYDELVTTAYKLKNGEYSTEAVKTELGYHVILRLESKEKPSLEVVRDDILDTLGEEYIKTNMIAEVDALDEIRKEYDMLFTDSRLEKEYNEYIKKLRNYYKN